MIYTVSVLFETPDTLKAQWIPKILENPGIQNLADVALANPIGTLLWSTNISPQDVDIPWPQHNFWKDALLSLAELHYIKAKDVQKIEEEIIWLNSNIRINNKPIKPNSLYKLGIVTVSDLMDDTGQFLSYEQVRSKKQKDFSFTELYAIHNAIKCAKTCSQETDNQKVLDKLVPSNIVNNPRISNTLYKRYQADPNLLDSYVRRWQNSDFPNLDHSEILLIIRSINKITNVPKFRSFQYRFALGLIITNVELKKFKIKSFNICTFCQIKTETLRYLFYLCPKIQPLLQWIRTLHLVEMSWYNVAFCCVNINPKIAVNMIILFMKYYIYIQ